MSTKAAVIIEEPEIDPIDAIIAAHNGDARAAVTDLMHRIQHLRHQLSLSSAVMSKGLTRGWQPSLDQT
ncbi:dehydrogenase [Rhizobium leguminosarum]|uniref:dehydrogenase n=1 Tax=Rhizobium leguminosarum TaxID=384 RepID=UPI00143F3AE4|nr:dehydrogenase [Rhizobium leguminosarum]NKL24036.1 dehydrogenase [Rhizobium leguminosarum bv. viciae]